MIPSRRKSDPYMLVTGMASVKMGDHIAQIGCAHGGRLGAVAAKTGLSGRAVAYVPDEASAARARAGAAEAGVLVDVEVTPLSRLPAGADAFDLVLVDDSEGLLGDLRAEERVALARELLRVLKPGARVLVIGATPRSGLGALFSRRPKRPPFDAAPLLKADGFRLVRLLGEREGLKFVEGIKPRRDAGPGR